MSDNDPKTVHLPRPAPLASVADIDATQPFTGVLPPFVPPPAAPTAPSPAPSPAPQYDQELAPTLILSAAQGGRVRPSSENEATAIEPRRRSATLPGTSPGAEPDLRRAGRYQILDKLGRGGMATVFRAHDPGIGRDVAIKFLHASLCEDDACRIRFLREAGAAGRLSHPHIATVHDVGEIDGRPYMAMELLTGESLAEELEQKKTLPVHEVVNIGIELAMALDYAHSKGIVHRDIKPGNILRAPDSRAIKVTDFGIAHIENPMDESGGTTRVGDILGTPQYMSPEQARGDKIDGRSDLFAVGIVLYQMITGKRPFGGDSLVVVATRIANDTPAPIDKQRADVPAALRRVIDRCLAKQAANRFQTGAELAAALTKVQADIQEAARHKNRPHIVPLRVKWAATMALIVAVVMGLTATLIMQRQQAAMMAQVSDYGSSMARFIAAQNAANVLGEEWDSIEVAVQEIMKTGNFERVVVIDLGGIARVSSVQGQSGIPYKPAVAESLAGVGDRTAVSRYAVNGESILGFDAPITFQERRVGRVALGIPEKPLTQVARLSMLLMGVLALVTVLSVAIAMYFVANWFAAPVRLLSESMDEIAKGRFDHRIREQRKDEFGQLFQVFDNMAAALQARAESAPVVPPTAQATPAVMGAVNPAAIGAQAELKATSAAPPGAAAPSAPAV